MSSMNDSDATIPPADLSLLGRLQKSRESQPGFRPTASEDTAPAMGIALFLQLSRKEQDLFMRKNAGYAGAENSDPWANFRLAEGFGIPATLGVLVRMSDKWSRLQSLIRNPANEQVGESLEDTLMDLSVYAKIEICLLREEEQKKSVLDRGR